MSQTQDNHRFTCPLCEALCGVTVAVADGRAQSVRGDPDDPLSRGHVCPKVTALLDLQEDPDRLREPLRRKGRDWEPISWETAMDELCERVIAIRKRHGRHAFGVYYGNPNVHHFGNVLAIQLAGRAFRTRNNFSATSADQLPHQFAQWAMFGHQLLFPVADVDRSDLVVLIGSNPAASNGSLLTAPGLMRRFEDLRARGGRLIVVDPRRTRTAEAADQHIALRPGTDALLLLAVLCVIDEQGWVDEGAWRGWSDGLEALLEAARRFPPERVAAATGVSAEEIRGLARALHEAPSAALHARIGACTQRFGGLSLWLALAVNVVTGNLDRPGGLMFPTPAFDVAAMGARFGATGHFDLWRSREADLPEFSGELPVSALASEIETPGDRQIRALLTVGGNPALSIPDSPRLAAALDRLEFMAAVDIYLNETTRHAHLILPVPPPLSRDHYGLVFHALAVRNTARWSDAVLPAEPGTRDEWEVLMTLASRLLAAEGGVAGKVKAAGYQAIRWAGAARVLDFGLRTGPHRLSLAKLRARPEGLDLGPLVPRLPGLLPAGRVQLAPAPMLADLARLEAALEDGSLAPADRLLLIGRRDLRSNNSWLHNSPRLMKGQDRCTLLVNPEDAAKLGLVEGGQARVRSRVGELVAPVALDPGLMAGVVSLPHGWGHDQQGSHMGTAAAHAGVNHNALTDPAHVDRLSGNAGFNGVPVEVTPV